MATEQLKRHESPSIDQIRGELTKAGCRKTLSRFRKFINYIRSNELPEMSKYSIILPVYKKNDKIGFGNFREYHFCQLRKNAIKHSLVKVQYVYRGNYG